MKRKISLVFLPAVLFTANLFAQLPGTTEWQKSKDLLRPFLELFGKPVESDHWKMEDIVKAFFVLLFLVIGGVLYYKYKGVQRRGNQQSQLYLQTYARPVDEGLPNDKMIVVAGISEEQIKQKMEQLRKIDQAQPTIDVMRLHPVNELTTIITFSTNIPLYMFYSAISSFNPEHLKDSWRGRAVGWATLRIRHESEFQTSYAMFSKDNDKSYSSIIYITTQDNQGWLFDMYPIKYRQMAPMEIFRNPPYPYPEK